MKSFSIPEGEKVPSAMVEDITVTVGIGGDVLILEQPGDNIEPDLLLVFGKGNGRKLVAIMQEWLDAEESGGEDA